MDLELQLTKGGIVDLPEGDFYLTKPLFPLFDNPLVLRGQGPQRTRLHVANNLDGAALINLSGKPSQVRYMSYSWWEISQLSIIGNNYDADCLNLSGCTQGLLSRIQIFGFNGHAIRAWQWWDSDIIASKFTRCGNIDRKKAAVHLSSDKDRFAACNNLHFTGVNFEQNPYISLYLGRESRFNSWLACKFHGTQPEPAPYDHVWMDNAKCNFIGAGTNFTSCGGASVVQNNCIDNTFEGVRIGNSRNYGMRIYGAAENCPLGGINWVSDGRRNTPGNIFLDKTPLPYLS